MKIKNMLVSLGLCFKAQLWWDTFRRWAQMRLAFLFDEKAHAASCKMESFCNFVLQSSMNGMQTGQKKIFLYTQVT